MLLEGTSKPSRWRRRCTLKFAVEVKGGAMCSRKSNRQKAETRF